MGMGMRKPSVGSRLWSTKLGLSLSIFFCHHTGVGKIKRTEHRKQMTEDKGQAVFWHLNTETWHPIDCWHRIHLRRNTCKPKSLKITAFYTFTLQTNPKEMDPKSYLSWPGLVYPPKNHRFIDQTPFFRWLILRRAINKGHSVYWILTNFSITLRNPSEFI